MTLYACGPADVVAVVDPVEGDYERGTTPLQAWTARTGGAQISGLTNLAGNPITSLVPDSDGRIPFNVPDTYTGDVWVGTSTGPRTVVYPANLAAQLAAIRSSITPTGLPDGVDGQMLLFDGASASRTRWATPAQVVDDELQATISVPTVTSGALPGYTDSGLEVPVAAGESWWLEAELVYDASTAAGLSLRIGGVGSVTNLASTGFLHGTMRGRGAAGANQQVPLLAGTIPTGGGSTQNTQVTGDFNGAGLGAPVPLSVNVKAKIGVDTSGLLRLQFRQAALDSSVSTVNLYQGSWAIFSKAGV